MALDNHHRSPWRWTLVLLLCAGCSVEIVHDVDENTANDLLAVLNRHGIEGDKVRAVQGTKASYTVAVPRSEAAEAWKVLRQENLPRAAQQGLGEVFANTSLVPTATQERALMHHALAGELSRTLQSVEGVLEARVHLVLTARDPLTPPDAPVSRPKASVLLRVRPHSSLSRESVQKLVAGSVKDLQPERVSVVVVKDRPRQRQAAAATGALRGLGPFRVAPGSRTPLLLTLVAALALVALLGAANILLLRRLRRLAARSTASDGGVTSSRLEGSLGLIERSLGARSRSRTTGAGRDNS